MIAGTPTTPQQIVIGRSFKSGASITFPDQGLKGHVGINRIPGAGGTWESGATVTIGSNTLTEYSYPTTATSIGGGSVGLTPYRLHDESCSPPNGGAALTSSSSVSNVRLRHYGPLAWTTGLPAVSRRLACTNDSYLGVSVRVKLRAR